MVFERLRRKKQEKHPSEESKRNPKMARKDNKSALKRLDIPKDIPKELYEKIDTKKKCQIFLAYLMCEVIEGRLSEYILKTCHPAIKTYMESMGWITKAPLIMQTTGTVGDEEKITEKGIIALINDKDMDAKTKNGIRLYVKSKTGKEY